MRKWEFGSGKWEFGSGNSEVGSENAEVGNGNSEVGIRKWECGSGNSEVGIRKWEVGMRKVEVGPVVVPKEWDFRLLQATPRQDAAARMRKVEKKKDVRRTAGTEGERLRRWEGEKERGAPPLT